MENKQIARACLNALADKLFEKYDASKDDAGIGDDEIWNTLMAVETAILIIDTTNTDA